VPWSFSAVIGYAESFSRSHDAVIRVGDADEKDGQSSVKAKTIAPLYFSMKHRANPRARAQGSLLARRLLYRLEDRAQM
jgi:hypothetical protein